MNLAIDVLICAYNEAPHIPRLLESLRQQSAGMDAFRVLFVDNASDDATREVVEENAAGLNLEYLHESILGKSRANNTGYKCANAPYVAHIDADCEAETGWIENILRVIEQEQPDMIGGPYFPYYIVPKPVWFKDSYNSHTHGDQAQYLPYYRYLAGGNMVWRRQVVEILGGFSVEKTEYKGRSIIGGEEVNLQVRAHRELPAFSKYYDPRIIVYHLTRPKVMSPGYQCKLYFLHGIRSHEIGMNSPMSFKLALWVLIRESFEILRTFTLSMYTREREKYPYRENYVYEEGRKHFRTLGLALGSLMAKLPGRKFQLKNDTATR